MNKNLLRSLLGWKKNFGSNKGLNWALSLPEDQSTFNIFGSSYAFKFQEEFSKINHFAGYSSSHMSLLSIISLFKTDLPESYLEIGVNEGLSLYTLLSGISFQRLLNDLPYKSKPILKELVLADSWGNNYGGTGRSSPKHIETLLSSVSKIGNVTILNGDSKDTIPHYFKGKSREKNLFDFIYVDGDHSFEGANTDIENVLPYVGKVLLFDDMYHPVHYKKDNLLNLHKHYVKKLKNDFYIFINRHGYGFSAFIRKTVFDNLFLN